MILLKTLSICIIIGLSASAEAIELEQQQSHGAWYSGITHTDDGAQAYRAMSALETKRKNTQFIINLLNNCSEIYPHIFFFTSKELNYNGIIKRGVFYARVDVKK
ncbi:hypothetical protein TAO_0188 [Candidatus Nitrosoglobus terrae]|uniref:Uncharacterized protein n=1 Tax=Candidatus Nitrosoglobus terrae TaxID=1630141 RepID=A0A1Q2SKB1_9GAMM|nr:hypothetical protein [Candidatus Nitrosoglobus terrae]BAW79558.1 hypothetical protein TAO_0188 [Candidatus Nitrosoglobus terrae]